MPQLRPGETVDRFRIVRLVGIGGMGTVYEACDGAGQRWAMKVLQEGFLRHPIIPKRFQQEALAARALSTPHAVKVEATGALADGTPYILMEYLQGLDLKALAMRNGGRLDVQRALALVDQAACALQEAHARGILHRDLKPDNVFVLPHPRGEFVKIVDFGISKIVSREDGIKLTRTGTTLGTPHYMPVEQLRGAKDLDDRVDVYALGVLVYELLAGVRPFDGTTYEDVIMKVATTAPALLRSYRPDVPEALAHVISRAMAREREARVGSMAELRALLRPFWSGQCPLCAGALAGSRSGPPVQSGALGSRLAAVSGFASGPVSPLQRTSQSGGAPQRPSQNGAAYVSRTSSASAAPIGASGAPGTRSTDGGRAIVIAIVACLAVLLVLLGVAGAAALWLFVV